MSYKGLLVSALISTLAPTSAFAAYWAPHIGADYKWWGLEPNESYEDIFPYLDHGFNFYVGTRINGYFGADIGYEESTRKDKRYAFVGGEVFFVTPQNPFDASYINMRVRDFHLDLNFYWEVWRNFELIFMGGLALWHIDTHINQLIDDNWIEFRNESENKAMGRIGLGVQYNVMPCLGLKFLVNSDPAIRVNDIGWDQNENWYSITPYKTAITYSIGIVYSFSNPRRHRVVEEYDKYYEDD